VTAAALCISGRPEATITWSGNARATSWTLERQDIPTSPGAGAGAGAGASAWTAVAVLPGSVTSFRDDRVGESHNFHYRVRPDLYRWEGVFSDASAAATIPDAVSAAGC
jgi:hypothetical protein